MNFQTAYVIQFVSVTKTTFSQGGATKIKSKQFSELGIYESKDAFLVCFHVLI